VEVYKRWQSQAVPDVPISSFDFRHQYADAPWICLKDGRQLLYTTNPMRATAYHLAVHLSGRCPEFIAAYKLNAWCIMNDCYFLRHHVLAVYFMDQQDSAYVWWTSTSRNLFPYVNGMQSSHWNYTRDCDLSEEWEKVVDLAAEKWSGIAAHLGILKIPDFMEHSSTEYKEAEAYYHKQDEERDRDGTLRQLRLAQQQMDSSRLGIQHHSLSQLFQDDLVRDTFDLCEIHFRQLMLRVRNLVCQPTVRRQKQVPFTIQIEPPRFADSLRLSQRGELVQGQPLVSQSSVQRFNDTPRR
jgi:hypothetical protein